MLSIPAILVLVLFAIGLLLAANMHGDPKVGKISFWHQLIITALWLVLLWCGGFFAAVP